MTEIGQRSKTLIAASALGAPGQTFGAGAFFVTALACAWAWPFTVDDALISIRYARHVAEGAGYVWNAGARPTDGVTPLPWAWMLVPLAHAAPLIVLERAKVAGATAWVATATAWGVGVGRARAPLWAKVTALALLAVDVPVAAHSVSGMETAFATSAATLAALNYRKPLTAAALGGLASALRPELVVWAVVAAVGFSRVRVESRFRTVAAGSVAALPFVASSLFRAAVFGSPAPLSLLAKPSDLAHGASYAGAAALFTLAPVVLSAPWPLFWERGPALVLAVSAIAHFAAVAAAGGDWMPYARLVAPVVPSMLLAFVLASAHASPMWSGARVVLVLGLVAWLVPKNVLSLRAAGRSRSAMIARAPALLRDAGTIATVDIGWVSAVTEATVVDLAGVTDPEVAALGGGHTSKRIDATFLLAHAPDVVVFYARSLPPALDAVTADDFPRVVEARLARSELFAQKFEPAALLPLGTSGAGYVLFTRR